MFGRWIHLLLLWINVQHDLQIIEGLWLGDCNKPLGLSSGEIPDSALSASSSHYPIVGPQRARLGREDGGGAWCPQQMVDQHQSEYLQVDLASDLPHLITAVGTQGRYGNGFGVEFIRAYTIDYQKPRSNQFIPYSRSFGSNDSILLIGNTDTFTEIRNELERPLIASSLRVKPFSLHPSVVCLRLELYGCIYKGKLQYYEIESREERYAVGEGVLHDGIVITSFYGDVDLQKKRHHHHSYIKRDWEFLLEEKHFESLSLSKRKNSSSSASNETDFEEEENLASLIGDEDDETLDLPSLPPGEIIAPDSPLGTVFVFNERLKFRYIHLYVDPIHPLIAGSKPMLKIIIDYSNFSEKIKHFNNFTIDLNENDFSNISITSQNLTANILRIHITAEHAEVNLQETYFDTVALSGKDAHESVYEYQTSFTTKTTTTEKLEKATEESHRSTSIQTPLVTHRQKEVPHPKSVVTLEGRDSVISSSMLNLKRSSTVIWTVHTSTTHRTYVGIAIGFSIGVGLLLGIWIWLWARTSKRKSGSPYMLRRPAPPDTLDMTCLVEGGQGEFGTQTATGRQSSPNEDMDCIQHFADDSLKTPLVRACPPLSVATVSSFAKPSNSKSTPFYYYSTGAKSTKNKRLFAPLSSKRGHLKKKAFKPFQEGLSSTIFPSFSPSIVEPHTHQDTGPPSPMRENSIDIGSPKWTDWNRPLTVKEEQESKQIKPMTFSLHNDMFLTQK